MPLISIVIPVYNTGENIIQCLESFRRQTFQDFEVVIIDDGSTDGTGQICDRYAEQDSRFRVFHKANAGVSAARNQGMDLSLGQWVTYVDSDDWLDPNYLEAMVECVHRNPDVDVVVNTKITINENQPRKWKYADSKHFKDYDTAVSAMLRDYVPDAMWCYMIRKDHLSDIRVDESIHYYEDMEFLFRVFQKARVCELNTCGGYHYRMGSVTHRKLTWKTLTAFQVVDKHAKNGLSPEVCHYMDGKLLLSVGLVGAKDPVYTKELNTTLKMRAAQFVKRKMDVGLGKKPKLYIQMIAWSPKLFYCVEHLKDKIRKMRK